MTHKDRDNNGVSKLTVGQGNHMPAQYIWPLAKAAAAGPMRPCRPPVNISGVLVLDQAPPGVNAMRITLTMKAIHVTCQMTQLRKNTLLKVAPRKDAD